MAKTSSKKGRIQVPGPKGLGPGTYLITAAQNNTKVHPQMWRNLLAYSKFRHARLLVVRFTYDKASHHSSRAQKGALEASDCESAWYDPAVLPYVCDGPKAPQQWRLAPTLILESHMNILPTKVNPLSGLQGFGGASSVIFAHATQALESIPTAYGKRAKFQYTTGACTKRNYIQKTAGQKAEFHHCFGALVVEVRADGAWWVRQINATDDGSFYDLGWKVKDGKVTKNHRALSVVFGDLHAMLTPEPIMRNLEKILDTLKPRNVVLHDTFDFGSGEGHHDQRMVDKFRFRYAGWSVRQEIELTKDALRRLVRPWAKTWIVASNHDRHPDRWLNEADPRQMNPANLLTYCEAQLARTKALEAMKDWAFTPWALRGVKGIRFLKESDSLLIKGVEHAWHGHIGPNGARGTLASLLKCAPKFTIGHHHSAAIRQGGIVVGVCSYGMDYAKGPGSWSVSHCVQYANGKRTIITAWEDDRPWL